MPALTPVSGLTAMVFDFDGTLGRVDIDFDLMRRRVATIASWFLDPAPTPDGQPILEWMDELAELISVRLGKSEAREFHSRARLAVMAQELDAAGQGSLFPEVPGLLRMLGARGVALGIVTRNTSAAVRLVFPDYEEYGIVLVPREEAVRVKPDPRHIVQALELMGGHEPGQALMVGDHPMDIMAGKRAGTLTAGVYAFNDNREALERTGPDFLAPDCRSLIDILEGQGLAAAPGADPE
ncbi:MAG: HAD family hydrolase [Deltaproteobacteria bacterium]|nr:HAD family hydrolase [Deltaproteobacteria bacterium]